MRIALETLLQIQREGLLQRFAIGGAIAASFYIEAVATEDLDVFAFIAPQPSGFVLLTPLYDRIKALGGHVHNEHIVIGDWPVQILPAFNPLIEEAVLHAPIQRFEDLDVPVISAHYVAAIALQLGRTKDYLRVDALIAAGACQLHELHALIDKHKLQERWDIYVRRIA
jgi:hypothetical protein